MLPDYPDRVIAAHRTRVERAALACQMALIGMGAWWLFESFDSESGLLFGYGPVAILFGAALLLPDLVDFGPVQRTRVSTACCIAWPPMIAIAEVSRNDGGNLWGAASLAFVAVVLLSTSRNILNSDVNSRRWRGMSTTLGFGLAVPVVLSDSNPESWMIIGALFLVSAVPPILSRDGLEGDRQDFFASLKRAERRILDMQSGNTMLQQPNSLLKAAREEGRKDPARGLHLISEAEREADRIMSFMADLAEIRDQTESVLTRAEGITGSPGAARRALDAGVEEMDRGSLRAAEQKFREARSKAENVESHWEAANQAIGDAEEAIGSEEGHIIDSIRSTLEEARKAMDDEDPEKALALVSEIPSQMGDVEDLMSKAASSIEDAETAVISSDESQREDSEARLQEAKDALQSGNASLAIGLADGVTRRLRRTGDAKSSVQRSLRQKKKIEEDMPSGEARSGWMDRLEEVESLASSGSWLEADESLRSLISDLESLSARREESREMLEFLQDDWKALRRRLDSSGVGPDTPDRIAAERALAEAEGALSEGRIDSCLEHLGEADSKMEALRRLV